MITIIGSQHTTLSSAQESCHVCTGGVVMSVSSTTYRTQVQANQTEDVLQTIFGFTLQCQVSWAAYYKLSGVPDHMRIDFGWVA